MVADSGATIMVADGFTYKEASSITDVKPAIGQDGTRVVISGERLRGHAAKVVRVHLAGVEATITAETDDTVLVVASAYDGSVQGDVTVTADSGAVGPIHTKRDNRAQWPTKGPKGPRHPAHQSELSRVPRDVPTAAP